MKFIFLTTFTTLALNLGTFAATTYVGNGSSAWGGAVGNSSLVVDDNNAGILTFTFTAGGNFGGNALVIFIDSKSGGFNTTANFTDSGDPLRKAISGYTATDNNSGPGRSTTALPFSADYAIAADSGYGGLWELSSTTHTHQIGVGSLGADPVSSKVLSLNVSNLGLTANSGGSFSFFGMLVSGSGFTSPELIGASSTSGASGWGNTLTVGAGSTYTLIPEPSTPLLMGLGLACLLALRRIQKA